MTRDDAESLGKRIINTWHGGPPLLEWVETLTTLDAGTAGTTFIRLRNDVENAPSIARFMALYRGLATVHNQPTPDTVCQLCDGTRYVECTDDRRHAYYCRHRGTRPGDLGDCHCHAVDPCPRCATDAPAGGRAFGSLDEARDAYQRDAAPALFGDST